jgi:hypothetical protein
VNRHLCHQLGTKFVRIAGLPRCTTRTALGTQANKGTRQKQRCAT